MSNGYQVPPMVADAIFNRGKAGMEPPLDKLHEDIVCSSSLVELLMLEPRRVREGSESEVLFSYLPKHMDDVCKRAKMPGAKQACCDAINILFRRWRSMDESTPEFADSELIKTLQRVLKAAIVSQLDPPKVSTPFTSTPMTTKSPLHTLWGTAKERVYEGDAVMKDFLGQFTPIGGK